MGSLLFFKQKTKYGLEYGIVGSEMCEGDRCGWFGSSVVRWFGGSVVRWFGGSLVRWFGGSISAGAGVGAGAWRLQLRLRKCALRSSCDARCARAVQALSAFIDVLPTGGLPCLHQRNHTLSCLC